MALSRHSQNRFNANIWPGFVDAMTALLLVLTFVLTIFMIVQFILRETISGQDKELNTMSLELAGLSEALGLEKRRSEDLTNTLGQTEANLLSAQDRISDQLNQIAALTGTRDEQAARIADFEAQVAGLLSERADLRAERTQLLTLKEGLETDKATLEEERQVLLAQKADLEAANLQEISQKEALQIALANARSEIDQGAEEARLAAAKREAMETLIASLRADVAARETKLSETESKLDETETKLDETEQTRVLEAAAAAALRERLANSNAELNSMTLALEAQRKEAEDTLTLLAAAEAAKKALQEENLLISTNQAETLSEAEKQAALLAQANDLLNQEKALSAESQRQVALMNAQTVELRKQLNQLQGLLDEAEAKDIEAQVQIQSLGTNLNAALARTAAEERARAQAEAERATLAEQRAQLLQEKTALEERELERLAAEANDLRKFRSEFFGQLREVFEGQDRVKIVGDRFVFSSEVLFDAGSATLGEGGRTEIRNIANLLQSVQDRIPPEIDWVLRVDGHTDKKPLSGRGQFRDNWELSQARALSVVRYLNQELGIPANRLAANGFGEFQPIDDRDTPDAYATNRRIELKFTER